MGWITNGTHGEGSGSATLFCSAEIQGAIPEELLDTINYSGYAQPQGRPGQGIRQVYQQRTGTYAVTEARPTPGTLKQPTWKPPLAIGDRVRHGKFGIGVVVACNPVRDDTEVTVAFPGVIGVKKLAQKFAKFRKGLAPARKHPIVSRVVLVDRRFRGRKIDSKPLPQFLDRNQLFARMIGRDFIESLVVLARHCQSQPPRPLLRHRSKSRSKSPAPKSPVKTSPMTPMDHGAMIQNGQK